ncbi:NADPH-dependent FMN reductase [Streptomyces venezuelae]|uniref:NADPH-dependent FMN reductase n=1 Tax=Streptomyces venezuelae TaxID=54571 RepID=A0A5P2CU99_STRVZ|nr:NAD(P)H-dependent oxidoreductase [Streptomyces venezuelae]QES45577.1 NADPH-dependent FMN reductase [Streptomyces venezuelae]
MNTHDTHGTVRDGLLEAEGPLKLAVIVASTREGRFAPTVAAWFLRQTAHRRDLDVDVIDLAEARLPDGLSGRPGPEVAGVAARIDAADAYVVITPEYNHSYPASLKTAIDWHYAEWRAKPVGFVSYGGLSGGLRAVEHLRQVYAELHAVTVRDTVSFHGARSCFDASGEPLDPAGPETAAKTMLDQLTWWGRTLRDAKTVRPYAA